MPKAKKTPPLMDGSAMQELRAKFGDSAEILMKIANSEEFFPELEDKEQEQMVWDSMKSDYEIFFDEKGRRKVRPKLRIRVDIHLNNMKYQHPQLRGTEIRGSVDANFNITIQTFDNPTTATVIDITKPQELNDANRESS